MSQLPIVVQNNFQANNLFNKYTSTVTSGSTYVITNVTSGNLSTSFGIQNFTGSTAQTVQMPATFSNNMNVGTQYYLLNNSTAAMTVQTTAGGATITTVPTGYWLDIICNANTSGNPATDWIFTTGASSGSSTVGYTTTTTAAGTTTLTVSSTYLQYFTGSTTQTVQLPLASTLPLGTEYSITNNSTGLVTVTSSGGNVVSVLQPNATNIVTCILASGTTAASWSGGNVYTLSFSNPWGICCDGTNIWVVNSAGATVTKILASTGVTIGSYTVGGGPIAVCFDGTNIWTANYLNSTVTKLLASTGAIIGIYSVPSSPQYICFDGTNIWVNSTLASVTKIAATGAIVATYAVTSAAGVCFDGTYIWVVSSNGFVNKLSPSTGAIISTYAVGTTPNYVCFDGTNIWVTNGGSANVTKLLASTGAVIGTYSVGTAPTGICWDGTNIWVANNTNGTITKLSGSTGSFLGTYLIGTTPQAICCDGSNIWVANLGANTVNKLTQLGIVSYATENSFTNGILYPSVPVQINSGTNALQLGVTLGAGTAIGNATTTVASGTNSNAFGNAAQATANSAISVGAPNYSNLLLTPFTTKSAISNMAWSSVCWAPELELYCAVNASGGNLSNITASTATNVLTVTALVGPPLYIGCIVYTTANPPVLVGTITAQLTGVPGGISGTSIWQLGSSPGTIASAAMTAVYPDGGTPYFTGTLTTTQLTISTNISNATNIAVGMTLSGILGATNLNSSITITGVVTAGTTYNVSGVASAVAAVTFMTASFAVMTSPDGITWTGQRAPTAADTTTVSAAGFLCPEMWQSVIWVSDISLFIAVSSGPGATAGTGRIMTSLNGISWTIGVSVAGVFWTSVAWSEPQPTTTGVALGYAITNNIPAATTTYMTSSTGTGTWTTATCASGIWRSVVWVNIISGGFTNTVGGMFVAVGDYGVVQYSYSGASATWTLVNTVPYFLTSLSWSSELSLIASTVSDILYTSSISGNVLTVTAVGNLASNYNDNNAYNYNLSIGTTIMGSGVASGTYILGPATSTSSTSATTTLTVGGTVTGTFGIGSLLYTTGATNVAVGTFITALGTGTGGAGTYTTNTSNTIGVGQNMNGLNPGASATACTISGSVLTVGGTITGVWAPGMLVVTTGGTAVTTNTYITTVGTGTGGQGTYNLSQTPTAIGTAQVMYGIGFAAYASSCTISTTTLTVGGTIIGTFTLGTQLVSQGATAISPNTFIVGFGTGTGGAGTYTLSVSNTVGTAEIMTTIPNSGTGGPGTYLLNNSQIVSSKTMWTTPTGSRVLTSSNITNWVLQSTPVVSTAPYDNAWKSIVWSHEYQQYMAVARYSSTTGTRIMNSLDGIHWSTVTSPLSSSLDGNWNSICWNPSSLQFCAVSSQSGITSGSPHVMIASMYTNNASATSGSGLNNTASGLSAISIGQASTASGVNATAITTPGLTYTSDWVSRGVVGAPTAVFNASMFPQVSYNTNLVVTTSTTLTYPASVTFYGGQVITGTGITAGTYITGTVGVAQTATSFTMSSSQSISANTTITGSPMILANYVSSGIINIGMYISGNFPAGTWQNNNFVYISAFGSGSGIGGTGYYGTYILSQSPSTTVSSMNIIGTCTTTFIGYTSATATTVTAAQTLSGTYTLSVVSVSGFSSPIYVWNTAGVVNTVSYTGTSGNTFTGCTGGSGSIVPGSVISLSPPWTPTSSSTLVVPSILTGSLWVGMLASGASFSSNTIISQTLTGFGTGGVGLYTLTTAGTYAQQTITAVAIQTAVISAPSLNSVCWSPSLNMYIAVGGWGGGTLSSSWPVSFTGSIAAYSSTITGGSITSGTNVLVVSTGVTALLYPGMTLVGAGIVNGTYIIGQLSGFGSITTSSWQVSSVQTSTITVTSATGGLLSVTAVLSTSQVSITPGYSLYGVTTAMPAGTYISAPTVGASFTANIVPQVSYSTNNIVTASATLTYPSSVTFYGGQAISGTGITAGTYITGTAGATITGTTFTMSATQTIAANTTITGAATLALQTAAVGAFAIGETLNGTGVTSGTTINLLVSGSSGAASSTYTVSASQTVGTTGSPVTMGSIVNNGQGVAGGVGTYVVNTNTTVASQTIYGFANSVISYNGNIWAIQGSYVPSSLASATTIYSPSSVCWAPALSAFMAVGRVTTGTAGTYGPTTVGMRSATGLSGSWTLSALPLSAIWTCVCWSPDVNRFVAVSSTAAGQAWSSDGLNWTLATTTANASVSSVCWGSGAGLFVAVTQTGVAATAIQTSPTGAVWTAATAPNVNTWNSVCYSPDLNLFVAVASSVGGTTGQRVMTSSNGTTWSPRATPFPYNGGVAESIWSSVCWSSGLFLFIAVGTGGNGNRILTSPNGLVWTYTIESLNASWISVCWSPGLNQIAAVGNTSAALNTCAMTSNAYVTNGLASGTNSTAIGTGAMAFAANSTAIGPGIIANQPGGTFISHRISGGALAAFMPLTNEITSMIPRLVTSATYIMVPGDSMLVFTVACTITLLPASNFPGYACFMITGAAIAVTSSVGNVMPIASQTVGSAVVPSSGSALIVSRGDYWQRML
jgi:hypothetical protein